MVDDPDTVFVGVVKTWDGLEAVIWELLVAAFVFLDTDGRLDFSFLSSTTGQRTMSVKCQICDWSEFLN